MEQTNKVCPACNSIMIDGVCPNCGTKAEDSKADKRDEDLHGGVIAEATPAMSDQVMGEDIAEDRSDQSGPLQD